MAKITIKLEDWLEYLKSRVGVDVYVWGGNGEKIINLLSKLCEMEKSENDVDRVLTLLQKRLLTGVDIFEIRGEDCSGLAVKYLLEKGIIKDDTTANGLYNRTKGQEISLKDVRAGDYLFQGSDSNKWHVGYAISEKYAVESKNHDVGVVQTLIAERGWKYATRPTWYSDEPKPEKPVLTRELYLTDPYMRGDDVRELQESLNDRKYNCGNADGIFGKKTDISVRSFQSDHALKVDGIVGKNTAEMLGFIWEG